MKPKFMKNTFILCALLVFFAASTAQAASIGISGVADFDPAVAERRNNPQPTDSARTILSPTLTESTTAWFAGHQWVIIGWKGSGVASKQGTATLLLANADSNKPPVSVFFEGRTLTGADYAESDLRARVKDFFNSLPLSERGYIVPRDLDGGNTWITSPGGSLNLTSFNTAAGNADVTQYITGTGLWYDATFDLYAYHDLRTSGLIGSMLPYNAYGGGFHPDKIAGRSLQGEELWPLSIAEASLLHNTIRKYSSSVVWWLRSPGSGSNNVAHVDSDEVIVYSGSIHLAEYSVRPAFNLDISSILLTSAASGANAKPTATGPDLTAASAPAGPVKFTVLDGNTSNLSLSSTVATAGTVKAGDTVRIAYSNAKTGNDKFVSCVIEDDSGRVLFYGKLATAATGTASFIVPSAAYLPNGNYIIRLFNEQCNGDNKTDFASMPIPITVIVHEAVKLPGGATIDGKVETDLDGKLTLSEDGTLTLPDAGATKIVLPADTKIDPETGLITLPTNETAIVTTPNNTEIKITGGLSFDEEGQIELSDGARADVFTEDKTLIGIGSGSTIRSEEADTASVSSLASQVLGAPGYITTIVVGQDGGSITYAGERTEHLSGGAVITIGPDGAPTVTNNENIVKLKVTFQGRTAGAANVEKLTVKWIKGGAVIPTEETVTNQNGEAEITLP